MINRGVESFLSLLSAWRKTNQPKPSLKMPPPPLHSPGTFDTKMPSGHTFSDSSSTVRRLIDTYSGADIPLAVKLKVKRNQIPPEFSASLSISKLLLTETLLVVISIIFQFHSSSPAPLTLPSKTKRVMPSAENTRLVFPDKCPPFPWPV